MEDCIIGNSVALEGVLLVLVRIIHLQVDFISSRFRHNGSHSGKILGPLLYSRTRASSESICEELMKVEVVYRCKVFSPAVREVVQMGARVVQLSSICY